MKKFSNKYDLEERTAKFGGKEFYYEAYYYSANKVFNKYWCELYGS